MLFYIISLCYLLLLSNQNQSSSFPYPNQVYDKQRKKHFSVVIWVCCALKYLFPRMAFSIFLWVVPKYFFLLPTIVATFGKNWSNFAILTTSAVFSFFYFLANTLKTLSKWLTRQ